MVTEKAIIINTDASQSPDYTTLSSPTVKVTAHGQIVDLGGSTCTKRGFVYGTSSLASPGDSDPGASRYSNHIEESGEFPLGKFSLDLEDLDLDTTYYVRAFAYSLIAGYSYGEEVSFLVTEPGQDVTAEWIGEAIGGLLAKASLTRALAWRGFAESSFSTPPVRRRAFTAEMGSYSGAEFAPVRARFAEVGYAGTSSLELTIYSYIKGIASLGGASNLSARSRRDLGGASFQADGAGGLSIKPFPTFSGSLELPSEGKASLSFERGRGASLGIQGQTDFLPLGSRQRNNSFSLNSLGKAGIYPERGRMTSAGLSGQGQFFISELFNVVKGILDLAAEGVLDTLPGRERFQKVSFLAEANFELRGGLERRLSAVLEVDSAVDWLASRGQRASIAYASSASFVVDHIATVLIIGEILLQAIQDRISILMGGAEMKSLLQGGVMVTAENQDFRMMRGDTKILIFNVELEEGQTLEGGTLRWGLGKDKPNFVKIAEVLDVSTCKVVINPKDTESLEGNYRHELELRDQAGNVSTLARGKVTIVKDLVVPQ